MNLDDEGSWADDDHLLTLALSFIAHSGDSLTKLQLISKRWKELTKTDKLWSIVCRNNFNIGLELPITSANSFDLAQSEASFDPQPVLASSCHEAWLAWHSLFEGLGVDFTSGCKASLYQRAAWAFKLLNRWSGEHAPEIQATFAPPASAKEWSNMLQELDVSQFQQNLRAMEMVYKVHNGQNILYDDQCQEHQRVTDQKGIFKGIFGGYSAYSHLVCTRLFPLKRIIHWTNVVRSKAPGMKSKIVIAASYNLAKIFLLDAEDCQVCMWDSASPPVPAAPEGTVEDRDSILLWLQTFASRLNTGVYSFRPIIADPEHDPNRMSLGVNLFPVRGDGVSRAVTRGVEVVASAVLAIEQGTHIYSVRIRLIGKGGGEGGMDEEERGFKTCQLNTRHWTLSSAGGIEQVHGSGSQSVVGKFPLLREGSYRDDQQSHRCRSNDGVPPQMVDPGDEHSGIFVYQSQTQAGSLETFSGHIEFVPGSLREPTGPPFNVIVAPFPLILEPEYIY